MKVDLDTVEQLRRGYESAFDKIYVAYEKSLYFLILSIVKNEEVAKDLLQETFIKVFIEIGSLRRSDNFHIWISKVARNLSLNYIRKNDKYRELTPSDINEASLENYKVQFNYDLQYILSGVDNLIVIYHTIHGLTFKEIGTVLHRTTSCVAKKYYAAIGRVQRLYKEKKKLEYSK